MKPKGYAVIIVTIACLIGLITWLNYSPVVNTAQPPPPDPQMNAKAFETQWQNLIGIAASAPAGNPKAPYTLIECGDFQCPNCGNAAPVIEDMLRNSGGNLKVYFINYPIVRLHPHALEAAEAGMAAAAQGKFWQMYQLLYSHQSELIESEIEYDARSIPGLDTKKLAKDIDSHRFRPLIAVQGQTLQTIGIQSTPTFLVRKGNGPVLILLGTGGDKSNIGLYKFATIAPWLTPQGKAMEMAHVAQFQADAKAKAMTGDDSS